jgi:uncharacterized phage protein (TIGR01671 family)
VRELKFRIWDTSGFYGGNVMLYKGFSINASGDPVGFFLEPDATPNTTRVCGEWRNGGHLVVMQMTELHDKFGKNIWEGDVIRECTLNSIIWDDDAVVTACPTGVVIINPWRVDIKPLKLGKARFLKEKLAAAHGKPESDLHMSTYDGAYTWPPDIEVIGNIYENPELTDVKA